MKIQKKNRKCATGTSQGNRKYAKGTSQKNRKYAKYISLQHKKPPIFVLKRDLNLKAKRKLKRIQQLN